MNKTQTTPPPAIERYHKQFGGDYLEIVDDAMIDRHVAFLEKELEASRKEERAFIGEQKRKAYQMGYKEAQVASRKEVIDVTIKTMQKELSNEDWEMDRGDLSIEEIKEKVLQALETDHIRDVTKKVDEAGNCELCGMPKEMIQEGHWNEGMHWPAEEQDHLEKEVIRAIMKPKEEQEEGKE